MWNNRFFCFIRDLVEIYMGKHVSRSAAELSYFLTLSVFPTLICLYALLGKYIPTEVILSRLLDGIVPTKALETIGEYLTYVSEYSSQKMLIGGALLMATSSAAAFRSLHNIMAEIQGTPKYKGVWFITVSFLFSLVFLAVMYFAGVVIVTGEWFLNLLEVYINISWAWSWLRFVLLFAILLLMILGMYSFTSPRDGKERLLPGAMVSAGAMVIVGMIFSAMVSISVRYSLVYGSLASMVILMFWLYIFGNILIIGNAINFLFEKYKR